MRQGVAAVVVGGLLVAGLSAFYVLPPDLFRSITGPTRALTPGEDRRILEQRVNEYWQAKVAGNLGKAFKFEDPVRQKQLGKKGYLRTTGRALEWEEVKVQSIQIRPGGELADVRLAVRYHMYIVGKAMKVNTEAPDYWQKLDGSWYHVLDLVPLPTGKRPTIPGTRPKGAQFG